MTRTYSINDIFDLFSRDFDEAFSAVKSSNVFTGNFPPYDVEINKKTNDLRFNFALAGYSEDNIDLSFSGDYMILEVSGIEKEDDEFKVVHPGLRKSSAYLKLAVPSAIYDRDSSKAFFKDGLLIVDIPRREEEKPKKLKIFKN